MDLTLIADARNPLALDAATSLRARHAFVDEDEADVAVVVGGDGFMLHTLHRLLGDGRDLPLYGLNRGTVGFLMNAFRVDGLDDRVAEAVATVLRPLEMTAVTMDGEHVVELAINEVALVRASAQTAKIRISLDDAVGLDQLVGDGVLVATAAGSTAYNRSAGGPIVPVAARLLTLTPIAAFHPRGWRGALLACDNVVHFEVSEPHKRPVNATADSREVHNVTTVSVRECPDRALRLLFDPGHGLETRIVAEQFVT